MNKLVIIGNGFDLAHGLKTRYSDFILWYLNDITEKRNKVPKDGIEIYEDDLLEIKYHRHFFDHQFKDIKDFLEFTKGNGYLSIKYKHPFIEELIYELADANWVDIEYKYYDSIIGFYRLYEKGQLDHRGLEKNIQELNHCFSNIKNELEKYLSQFEINNRIIDREIETHINKLFSEIEIYEQVYFLNFNYTSTIEQYTRYTPKGYSINYIHGELNSKKNPIIFGYGDEMDLYYEKIERLNSNESLKYFKSFSYLKTKNYQDLSSFIKSNQYEVHIIGHSCGLSDRILLNSVFEHSNCHKINLFFHEKDQSSNDYFDKTIEISRHFKSESKHRMRNIIASEEESKPLKRFQP
ncbi:MAG: AbiH family protein [Bacteroidota bacterium]|nr:AbiH family protein [Bacteroidota bacterium]